MKIVEGSNFTGIKEVQRIALKTPMTAYSWVMSDTRMGQHVIARKYANCCTYYLIESELDLHAILTQAGALGKLRDYCTALIGSVEVEQGLEHGLDEVDILWVDPAYKGKGYGEGLHRLAYLCSAKGVISSTNIGSQYLATLIRLYNKEQAMQVLYDGYYQVDRSEIEAAGTSVVWGSRDLCDSGQPDLQFEWRKP